FFLWDHLSSWGLVRLAESLGQRMDGPQIYLSFSKLVKRFFQARDERMTPFLDSRSDCGFAAVNYGSYVETKSAPLIFWVPVVKSCFCYLGIRLESLAYCRHARIGDKPCADYDVQWVQSLHPYLSGSLTARHGSTTPAVIAPLRLSHHQSRNGFRMFRVYLVDPLSLSLTPGDSKAGRAMCADGKIFTRRLSVIVVWRTKAPRKKKPTST
ncbi:hypothetical protein K443DRAFT_99106, partial [Laccaria amethystina LaAM-08-1]